MSAISGPRSPTFVGEPSHSNPQTSLAARRAALEMDSLSLPPSFIETLPPVLNLGNGKIDYHSLCGFVRDRLDRLRRRPLQFIEKRDRHEEITPFAFNQVKIDEEATGLNGSWICYPDNDTDVEKPCIPTKYIAISAPSPSNFFSFMRMVQQKAVPLIISLSAFVENGRKKADPYLPYKKGNLLVDDEKNYQVLCTNVHPPIVLFKEWVLEQRDFELTLKGSSTPHQFTQLHLPHWHDHFPGAVEEVANLVRYVHGYCKEKNILAPIVIHSSAGVGRAGTFLNCKEAYERFLNGRQVRIFDIAAQSRLQRWTLGGNRGQYEMVYRVFEYLKTSANIQED